VTVPPLARTTLDRAAQRRTDAAWLARAWQEGRVLVVDVMGGARTLVHDTGEGAELVLLDADRAPDVGPEQRLFLGIDTDGTPLFAVDAPLPELPGARGQNLREVGHLLDDRDVGLLTAAAALAFWHAGHPYSSATGLPTRPIEGGWARIDEGGTHVWPRTDPAVIMLVHDGVAGPDGRCLLGHGASWAGTDGRRRFSCLAGFVEAGESAEAAVAREVREEVGVRLEEISYVASQAWPFPGSLMLGFTAYADPAQPLQIDPSEIADARWFSRREIAAAYAGEAVDAGGGARLALPMNVSIAAYLVRRWLDWA
jgi:NAD+ diphosphatase